MILEDRLKLKWNGFVCHLRGNVVLESELGRPVRFTLRHRKQGMVHELLVKADSEDHESSGYSLSLDFSSLALIPGIWDLYCWTSHDGRETCFRLPAHDLDVNDGVIVPATNGLWNVRDYETTDGELSFHVSPGGMRLIPAKAVYWRNSSVLEVQAEFKRSETDCFELKGALLEVGRHSYPLDESLVVDGERVAFSVDFSALPFSIEKERPARFCWRFGVRGQTRELRVPVGARLSEKWPTSLLWRLPGSLLQINKRASWLLPRLDQNDELIVEPDCPFVAAIHSADAHRWRSLGQIDIDIEIKLKDSWSLETAPEIESAQPLLRDADGTEVLLEDCHVDREFIQVRVDVRRLLISDRSSKQQLIVNVVVRGCELSLPVQDTDKLLESWTTFRSNARWFRGSSFRSFFVDRKSGAINLEIRPFRHKEKFSTRLMDVSARVIAGVSAPFRRNDVWLVGENLGHVAQDNGYAFFEHCMNSALSEKVFYVARTNNKHRKKLARHEDNVLRYNSFAHYYHYHLADKLIVAHGIRDVVPSSKHQALNLKPLVYLQHGIIAMKKISYNNDSYNGSIEMFVVSSEHEKELMARQNKMARSRLMVTGLPRYDRLLPTKASSTTILLMPTWRDWINRDETTFSQSAFLEAYTSLLKNPILEELLEKHDATIYFYPHIEIEKRFSHLLDFASERVRIASYDNSSVQDIIRESSILITDYSSIAWDFTYLKKPVVYYQFDREEYLAVRGSYVDLERDLPGYMCTKEEDVLSQLKSLLENGCQVRPEDLEKSARYYDFADQQNSARVYSAIKSLARSET